MIAGCRFVAGLQHAFQSWRKPFNPILGTDNLPALTHCLSHSFAMATLTLACSLRIHCESPAVGAGETWEATLDDGSEVYFEQISHHPPVSAFQLIGPGAGPPTVHVRQTALPLLCHAHRMGHLSVAPNLCNTCLQRAPTSTQDTRSQRFSIRAML